MTEIMWDDASAALSAEGHTRDVGYAIAAVEPFVAFTSAAISEQDFHTRMTLLADPIRTAVLEATGSVSTLPDAHQALRQRLVEAQAQRLADDAAQRISRAASVAEKPKVVREGSRKVAQVVPEQRRVATVPQVDGPPCVPPTKYGGECGKPSHWHVVLGRYTDDWGGYVCDEHLEACREGYGDNLDVTPMSEEMAQEILVRSLASISHAEFIAAHAMLETEGFYRDDNGEPMHDEYKSQSPRVEETIPAGSKTFHLNNSGDQGYGLGSFDHEKEEADRNDPSKHPRRSHLVNPALDVAAARIREANILNGDHDWGKERQNLEDSRKRVEEGHPSQFRHRREDRRMQDSIDKQRHWEDKDSEPERTGPVAASFMHPTERRTEKPGAGEPRALEKMDRERATERTEERDTDRRHQEYWDKHPDEYKEHVRLNAHLAADETKWTIPVEKRPYVCEDCGKWRNAENCPHCDEAKMLEEINRPRRGPSILDWLAHGLFPSGASAAKTAAPLRPGPSTPEADEFSAQHPTMPRTTRPRVKPAAKPPTMHVEPAAADPIPHDLGAAPTPAQRAAARVAKIAAQVASDNPHLSIEAARILARQVVVQHPEMLRSTEGI